MMVMQNRKELRLQEYDYSQNGYYFVTICTKDRENLLSRVVGGGVLDAPSVELSKYGKIVESRIEEINKVYSTKRIEKYVIMPNHVHFILVVNEGEAQGPSRTPAPTRANESVPAFVSTLKRFTNRESGTMLWQRGYYDHVIRNEEDYLAVWQYIETNPVKWELDQYYTD